MVFKMIRLSLILKKPNIKNKNCFQKNNYGEEKKEHRVLMLIKIFEHILLCYGITGSAYFRYGAVGCYFPGR